MPASVVLSVPGQQERAPAAIKTPEARLPNTSLAICGTRFPEPAIRALNRKCLPNGIKLPLGYRNRISTRSENFHPNHHWRTSCPVTGAYGTAPCRPASSLHLVPGGKHSNRRYRCRSFPSFLESRPYEHCPTPCIGQCTPYATAVSDCIPVKLQTCRLSYDVRWRYRHGAVLRCERFNAVPDSVPARGFLIGSGFNRRLLLRARCTYAESRRPAYTQRAPLHHRGLRGGNEALQGPGEAPGLSRRPSSGTLRSGHTGHLDFG